MEKIHIKEQRKTFFSELEEKVQEKILSIEMVCLEADKYIFDVLELKPQKAQALWGLLVFTETTVYFYANQTEQTILGFRIGNAASIQKEQLFSFKTFETWNALSSTKRVLFIPCTEKFALQVNFTIACDNAKKSGYFKIETQSTAKQVLEKMATYN